MTKQVAQEKAKRSVVMVLIDKEIHAKVRALSKERKMQNSGMLNSILKFWLAGQVFCMPPILPKGKAGSR